MSAGDDLPRLLPPIQVEPVEQVLDSTPMLGAAVVHDTTALARAGVRKLIDAVAALDKKEAEELRRGLRLEYSKPRAKPEGDWVDPDARRGLLTEIAMDAPRHRSPPRSTPPSATGLGAFVAPGCRPCTKRGRRIAIARALPR